MEMPNDLTDINNLDADILKIKKPKKN